MVVVVVATVREGAAEEGCVVVVVAAAGRTMHEHYATGARAANDTNLSWMTHCCRCCFRLGSCHCRCWCYPGHSGWGRSLQLSACYGDGEQRIDAFSKDGMGVSVDKRLSFTSERGKRTSEWKLGKECEVSLAALVVRDAAVGLDGNRFDGWGRARKNGREGIALHWSQTEHSPTLALATNSHDATPRNLDTTFSENSPLNKNRKSSTTHHTQQRPIMQNASNIGTLVSRRLLQG